MVKEAVEEEGAMDRQDDIELLICHGLDCINRELQPRGNRRALGYRNNNVQETLISVMHKYAVIWQKTPEQVHRAIL